MKYLLICALILVGCENVKLTDITTECPQRELINGFTYYTRGYGPHVSMCEYDSLGSLTIVCKACGYRFQKSPLNADVKYVRVFVLVNPDTLIVK